MIHRILLTVAVAALLLLPQAASVAHDLRLHRNVVADFELRTGVDESVSLLPHGSIGKPNLHTAPVRIAVEWGVLAAAAWLWLALRAAWVTRKGPVVWMVAAMLALSAVDYYFTLAGLIPAYYLLISAKGKEHA